MVLRFPTVSNVVFRRAPLVVVLCQVRFPPIYALLANAAVAGFQEAIRSIYPVSRQEEGAELKLTPGSVEAVRRAPIWRFSDSDGLWTVSLATDFVGLETPSYTHFGDFAERFEFVVDALHRTVHPADSVRVGLRKVNDLTHPDVTEPRHWRKLLNPALLGLLSDDAIPGSVGFAMSDLRLVDDRGDELAIRHGVVPDNQRAYRLDLDYSTARGLPIRAASGLSELLHEFAESETGFFMWTLTPEMHSFLEPQPRPGAQ